MKKLKLEQYGVQEMDTREIININGGGQQTPAWLIGGDSAGAGKALEEGAYFVYGIFKGFLLG